MQYAIISVINGSYKIEVESNNLQQVRTNFHTKCASLWNAPDVLLARVAIIDQSFGQIAFEEITHSVEPETETEE